MAIITFGQKATFDSFPQLLDLGETFRRSAVESGKGKEEASNWDRMEEMQITVGGGRRKTWQKQWQIKAEKLKAAVEQLERRKWEENMFSLTWLRKDILKTHDVTSLPVQQRAFIKHGWVPLVHHGKITAHYRLPYFIVYVRECVQYTFHKEYLKMIKLKSFLTQNTLKYVPKVFFLL